MDESPRWLFSQGRYSEANAIVCKMLTKNGKADLIPEQGFTEDQLRQALGNTSEPSEAEMKRQEDGRKLSDKEHKFGIPDLFRTPRLRNRTLNICLNW